VLLKEVVELVLPHGWFLPVTPGTQHVTVGGAIANDVHGKNHHRHGTFGEHVEQLRLVRTDGTDIECARDVRPEWFAATIGGMGLTGVIASAILRLRRVPGPWIDSQSHAFASLAEFFELSTSLSRTAEYKRRLDRLRHRCRQSDPRHLLFRRSRRRCQASVAAGDEAPADRFALQPRQRLVGESLQFGLLRPSLASQRPDPTGLPIVLLSARQPARMEQALRQGRLLPIPVPGSPRVESNATQALLRAIARSRQGSFLAVLKTFDDRAPAGLLSFPCAGTTLAIDFPNRAGVLDLFKELDAIVAEAGGRVYAAKDASAPRQMFERSFPKLEEFVAYRDPGIASDMSRRLFGH
jgi:hypothetical protein